MRTKLVSSILIITMVFGFTVLSRSAEGPQGPDGPPAIDGPPPPDDPETRAEREKHREQMEKRIQKEIVRHLSDKIDMSLEQEAKVLEAFGRHFKEKKIPAQERLKILHELKSGNLDELAIEERLEKLDELKNRDRELDDRFQE